MAGATRKIAEFVKTYPPDGRAVALAKPVRQLGYAERYSRSHAAVIRVYDDAGNVIEMHTHKGDFKEW